MSTRARRSAPLLPISAAALALGVLACQPPPEGAAVDDLGVVQVALTSVPTNGLCVRFTSTAGTKVVQQTFDGTSGMPLAATLRGLPYGVALSISADAFETSCALLTPASLATYISDVKTATLTAGETKMLTFTLKPTGNVSGTVDFLYLTMTPASATFGNVVIGQQGPIQGFSVKNIGMVSTSALTASISMMTGNTGELNIVPLSVPPGCPAMLPAGATCTVQTRMSPMVAGPKNGTLTVSAAQGGTVTAMLSGVGWNPAALTITPSADLGSVPLNSPGATMADLTVMNTGDQPTGPINVTFTNGDFQVAQPCPTVLSGLQSCHILVRFIPTMIGTRTGLMTINASPGGMASASLTGVGISPLTINPTSWAFGSAPVGMGGSSKVFIVQNIGLAPSTLPTVTASPAAFRLMPNMCTTPIPPGGTCQITIQLFPTAAGSVAGSLVVGAMPGWTAAASLSGSGT